MSPTPEEEAMRNKDRAEARATELGQWFTKGVEPRVERETEALRRQQQLRMIQGGMTTEARAAAAARSVEEIKRRIGNESTESKNRYRLARAFELFVALGIKGKPVDPKSAGTFKPGWLGRITEVTLSDESEDIREGVDAIVFIPAGEQEFRIALDVTYSTKKLDKKFRRVKNEIELGIGPRVADTQGKKVPALRVVVGVSDASMRDALREWGRDENPSEAYDSVIIGARIRQQIIAQLKLFEAYARECGKQNPNSLRLAEEYRMAREALEKWMPSAPQIAGLEDDPVHQGIVDHAKNIGKN